MVAMAEQLRIVPQKSWKESVAYTKHSGDPLIGIWGIVQSWNVASPELFGNFLAPFKELFIAHYSVWPGVLVTISWISGGI